MINLLTFTVNRGIIVNVKSNSPNGAEKENNMKYNRTITKAAEIISAAPVGADADRYAVAVYQPRHRIPSTVWALTIDTAHDGWTIAARTMECIYNRDTMGADMAPRHALASAITGRIRITAPAAETETETTERAAEPHYLPAAAAQEEKTPGLNPMCRECTRCGIDCKGTTCRAFTGCIYREWLGSRKRSETPAHITDASTAKLLDYWDYVRRLSYSAATAMTRGWVLDELARRDPAGYDRWVDDDTPGDYDATLRDFIRCDDAHIAWYAPQCEITWRPGDAAREGAKI